MSKNTTNESYGYLAMDSDGTLCLHAQKPVLRKYSGIWVSKGDVIILKDINHKIGSQYRDQAKAAGMRKTKWNTILVKLTITTSVRGEVL